MVVSFSVAPIIYAYFSMSFFSTVYQWLKQVLRTALVLILHIQKCMYVSALEINERLLSCRKYKEYLSFLLLWCLQFNSVENESRLSHSISVNIVDGCRRVFFVHEFWINVAYIALQSLSREVNALWTTVIVPIFWVHKFWQYLVYFFDSTRIAKHQFRLYCCHLLLDG